MVSPAVRRNFSPPISKSVLTFHNVKPFVLLEVDVSRRTAFALVAVLENVELTSCVSRRKFVGQRQQAPNRRSVVVKSVRPCWDTYRPVFSL